MNITHLEMTCLKQVSLIGIHTRTKLSATGQRYRPDAVLSEIDSIP